MTNGERGMPDPSGERLLSRREFFKAGAVAALALGVRGDVPRETRDRRKVPEGKECPFDIDAIIRTVSENVEGIAAARIDRPENAKRVAVVIEQVHINASRDPRIIAYIAPERDAYLSSVNAVQRDIYRALLHLKKVAGLHHVFCESVTDESRTSIAEGVRDWKLYTGRSIEHFDDRVATAVRRYTMGPSSLESERSILEKVTREGGVTPKFIEITKQAIQLLEREIVESTAVLEETAGRYPYVAGAAQCLASEGQLELQSSVDEQTLRTAWEWAQHQLEAGDAATRSSPERQERLFEARERALLDRMQKAGGQLAVGVMGDSHDLHDTAREWNTRRPDDAFAVVTLTPTSIARERATSAPSDRR